MFYHILSYYVIVYVIALPFIIRNVVYLILSYYSTVYYFTSLYDDNIIYHIVFYDMM